MLFSDEARVIYARNPLINVICQLRFPAILSINNDSAKLAKFQDAIRADYPLYKVDIEQQPTLLVNNIGAFSPALQSSEKKNYNFISADGKWTINLTNSFISLSTGNYIRWEIFKDKFKNPLYCFIKEYNPAFFERIGLRYVDAFSKKDLGLTKETWKDLINSTFLGALSAEDVDEDNVVSNSLNLDMKLDDTLNFVSLHTGLGTVGNSQEKQFIIDADYYSRQRTLNDKAFELTDKLHSYSTRMIRGAIMPKLNQALEPKSL